MGLAQFIKRKMMNVTPTAARAGGGPWSITYPALANSVVCQAKTSTAGWGFNVMKALLATALTDLWVQAVQVGNATAVGEYLVAITSETINTATPQVPTPARIEACIPVYMGAVNTARLIELRPPCLIHAGQEINAAVALGASATGPKTMEVKVLCSVAK